MMDEIGMAALAFLCGLTLAGLPGSLMELWAGRRLALDRPFICRHHVARSLALTAASGPFMLVNEGLEARRAGRRGPAFLAACLALATVWLLASGTVVAELAFALRDLLL